MLICSGQRRDVDDVAAATFFHLRDRYVTTVEDPEEICFQHCAELLRRSPFDSLENADAGVVNQNIETAEFFDGVVDHSLHLIVITYVTDETKRARAEFLDCFFDLGLFSCGYANGNAFTQ